MTRESTAKAMGLNIVARVVSHAAHAHDPAEFTTAPVPAMQKALQKAGWSVEDVDLWEVNEAFAVVPMGWPSAQAPPFTFSFSCGMPISCMATIGTTAKASLTSHRSTSSTDQPAF